MIEEFRNASTGLRQNIVADPANAKIIIGQARAADLFHQIVDALSLSQRVNKGGHRADVLTEGADRDQVTRDAVELAGDHPAKLAAPRDFDSRKPFRRHAKSLIGEHGRSEEHTSELQSQSN